MLDESELRDDRAGSIQLPFDVPLTIDVPFVFSSLKDVDNSWFDDDDDEDEDGDADELALV